MATTIFADSIPEVKKRGTFTVLTYEFEGVETHVVLTAHAATATSELLRISGKEPDETAEIIQFEA